jgi:hypothetical protein
MALGQTAEPQQTQTQGQTKETEATAPAKGKKMRPAQERSKPQAKPETGTNVRGQTDVKGRAPDVNRNAPGTRSSTSQTNVRSTNQTNVNLHEGERARVQVASQRSVQSWAASERVLRPTIWGEPFPVDRQHVLRVRGQLLGCS